MACTVATSVLPRVALALTLGAALAAPGAPAVAASQSAVFTLSPLVINGSSNVSATAIND